MYKGQFREQCKFFLALMKDTSESVEAEWKYQLMTDDECTVIWTNCLSYYRLKPIRHFLKELQYTGVPLEYLKQDWDDASYCSKHFEIHKFSIAIETNFKKLDKFIVECRNIFK